LATLKNYRDWDELVTLKLFDFESVDDYYIKCSSLHDLINVNVPSIYFNAKDDQLSPIDTVDIENSFKLNPNIMLVLTRWGGHVCWFKGAIKPKRVK
jgi:predicted alpha/beta-fold hydrolase